MITRTSLLLILCCTLTSALSCDWLSEYKRPSNETRALLELMGRQLINKDGSVHPLQPVHFPRNLLKHLRTSEVESQLLFIRDSLKLISCLYQHPNMSSAPWGSDKTERFLTVVHRQIAEVSVCVSTSRPRDRQLTSYYRRLARRTVSCTGCSTASWELLREETGLRLDQLELLVASINRSSTASSTMHSAASQQQHNNNADTTSEDCHQFLLSA